MYFAIEINQGQSCPYMLEEVGMWLDYYIVKVDDKAFLKMDLSRYNPIPLTEEEANAHWFAAIRTGRVKIMQHDWERFGRPLSPDYEISKKGKIVYPITRQDEQHAVSLMKKILYAKASIWLENQMIFTEDLEDVYALWDKIEQELNNSTSLIDTTNVYFLMQKELYKEDPE